MGRSAKITRCVGLRQMKNARKGVTKVSATKDRRRKEKAERIRQTLEQAADERREQRKKELGKRQAADAKASAGVKPTPKGFFSLGAAADALCTWSSRERACAASVVVLRRCGVCCCTAAMLLRRCDVAAPLRCCCAAATA